MDFSKVYTSIILTANSTDAITWLATVTAVIYVYLALRENIWCWSFGIASSGLSVYIYYQQNLSYESLLNVFYIVLGVYGWIKWNKLSTKQSALINHVRSSRLLIFLLLGLAFTTILGYISSQLELSTLPYSDAAITTFSVLGTWMTAKKMIENWIIWFVVDSFAAIIYFYKGPELYLFGILFIFYAIMSVAGYYSWKKKLK